MALRGRLVVVAIHATPPPVNLFRMFWRELTLIGARVYERSDFEQAIRLLHDGSCPGAQLISRVEPMSRVAAAFDSLESRRGDEDSRSTAASSATSMFDLTGKLALVTGCRRGIGLAMAEALAAAGADIIGASQQLEPGASEVQQRVEAAGRSFAGYQVDFADRGAVRELR